MGRPHQKEEENEGTVGVYGIGMKRAIFKMGRDCSIQSNNPDGAFTVDITPDWIDGDGWKIPMHESDYDNKNPTGTTIEIKKLHSNVAQKFNESTYLTDLFLQIKHSLSFIIQKGFKIELNGVVVEHN
ncbi:histidine kinase-, DNA gyrase B-, and HSP90-like ATPase family protein, partial [Escherichia coli 95.1288]